ncbi:hypothetical protein D3Y55_21010 [Mesorhizobium sp. DCY119]|nr:hypothetical protein D3Y55_21010 [Mesorhizobium sp. DCY119]
MKKWETLTELAELLLVRGRERKSAVLGPDTAHLVGLKLLTADAKPTHKDVIEMICDSRCKDACVPCTFKANAICRAYGQRWRDKPGADSKV